jgi:hypothetical protein
MRHSMCWKVYSGHSTCPAPQSTERLAGNLGISLEAGKSLSVLDLNPVDGPLLMLRMVGCPQTDMVYELLRTATE